LLVAMAIVSVYGWTRLVPRAVVSVNGQALGHLPAGIRPEQLNLLIVTAGHDARRIGSMRMDSTRSRRPTSTGWRAKAFCSNKPCRQRR